LAAAGFGSVVFSGGFAAVGGEAVRCSAAIAMGQGAAVTADTSSNVRNDQFNTEIRPANIILLPDRADELLN
jgi:hypothetical protein